MGQGRPSQLSSDARFGEAQRARGLALLAQVEPPGPREARPERVEAEEDHQRELRAAGQRDRLAEDPSGIQENRRPRRSRRWRSRPRRPGSIDAALSAATRAASPLPRALCRNSPRGRSRDHAVGRTVADAGGCEQDQEHHEEAGEVLGADEVEDADRRRRHRDEIPEGDDGAPDLVGKQATNRAHHRANQRTEERDANRDRRELRLDQQRKCRRVADEGTESADIDVGHDPGVLALDDRKLVLDRGLGRGQVVHEEDSPEHRDDDRQHPLQSGIRQIETAGRRALAW